MRLYLLEGVKNHTNHNQQRGAAEELGEVLADSEEAGKGGQDGYYAKEY
jgi:hypothetical protein